MKLKWIPQKGRLDNSSVYWCSEHNRIEIFLDVVTIRGKAPEVIPDIYIRNSKSSAEGITFQTIEEAKAWAEALVVTGAI